MTERLLQFIWQFQYFNRSQLQIEQGETLTVIGPGIYNTNQGADFLQAKLKIGNVLWAGNIELHIKASDWNKHAHNNDPNYKNVILHVVWENDLEASDMPVLVLQHRVSSILLNRYEHLMQQQDFVPCANNLQHVKDIIWLTWKDRLFVERMKRKTDHILKLLEESNNHWEEVCWWLIARNFGIKVNAEAFEIVARSVSINILAKQKNSIQQLEALLLGQAGFLENDFDEAYPQMLKKEYRYLSKKYTLQRPQVQIHFLRMRPPSFPTVRLAQLAAFIQSSNHLFSQLLDAETIEDLLMLFNVTANDYWHYHYKLDELARYQPKKLGKGTIINIIINTVGPLLFAYDNFHSLEIHKERVLKWMQELPAENNAIMEKFEERGVKNSCAFDSQSLLELKMQYCESRRCLSCSIGNVLLKFTEC
ncbi:DUF2851 family protein [Pinibacter aurantiacus]|uniref:DUF2851 family protein n=1 Tax=Pinibacter aurantiacus TaxID=2851599 RepID=A0A9E2SF45_9BACT|nr:DUF2851 family protein [Pinibacter aurantiacus]MBV4358960.1 DUF2851 family protein [Pinibacter aurantiacus]